MEILKCKNIENEKNLQESEESEDFEYFEFEELQDLEDLEDLEELQGENNDDTKKINKECKHDTINDNGSIICIKCGEKLNENLLDNENRYYGSSDTRFYKDPSRHNKIREQERSLRKDLLNLNIPESTIEKANTFYNKIILNDIYRAKNRTSIVFACTYYALLSEGKNLTTKDLSKKFKITQKDVSNGNKIFCSTFRNLPKKKYITPLKLSFNILNKIQILDIDTKKKIIEDLDQILKFIYNIDPLYTSCTPQTLASGLVYYYLKRIKCLENLKIKKEEFSAITNLTDITYTKIANNIEKNINSYLKTTNQKLK